ncbi:hypothetical protein CLIB1444_06S01442 [[Candida] jaroonii]|uniref:Uncharacterized protein n=1 Tax=[Candida] jaroonii TaxID=467808 RepID=A0ACA9Y8Q0_9ASCO|nr:hypothetical protein CLIB1444_06S01442 [[Candida] jaroonii]
MAQKSDQDLQLTDSTPQAEREQYIDNSPDVTEENTVANGSNTKDDFETIHSQPVAINDMTLEPNRSRTSEFNGRSSYSISEAGSGYDRDENECTEFCLDFCTCFGLFDNCCPTDSDGCVTSTAVFIGNILFACCRCK